MVTNYGEARTHLMSLKYDSVYDDGPTFLWPELLQASLPYIIAQSNMLLYSYNDCRVMVILVAQGDATLGAPI